MAARGSGMWRKQLIMAALLPWLSACLDDVTHCDDGSICPVGAVCLSQGGCATPAQVDACGDAVDGTPCALDDIGGQSGVCIDHACNFGRCGDGDVEPRLGEVCDVAVTAACSRDCTSTLACGNGIVDGEVGETCDDQNGRNHDGCSNVCRLEQPVWNSVGRAPELGSAAAAYDPLRRTVVLFGGQVRNSPNGDANADTWELHRDVWIQRRPLQAPSARLSARMVFDASLGKLVLFGGFTSAGPAHDTWTYDGSTWRQLTPSRSPPDRSNHAMAYDAARDRVVVVGGSSIQGAVYDTWEFDGSTWSEAAPSPVCNGPAMTYESTRQRIVMVCAWLGAPGPGGELPTTWAYDGSAWTELVTPGHPRRSSVGIVFDVDRQRVVTYGGYNAANGEAAGGMWQLDGDLWVPVAQDSSALGQRSDPVMVYDGSWARTLVGAGMSYSGIVYGWNWGGQDGWPYGSPNPPYASLGQTVWDDARGLVLVMSSASELWRRADAQWKRSGTGAVPDFRASPAVAYDAGGSRVLAVGGTGATVDVFEFDGSAWTSIVAANPPPARRETAVAFDDARGRLVIVGGIDDSNADLDDAWEFDGASWSPIALPPALMARHGAAMAYDPMQQRVVLFGGSFRDATGVLPDVTYGDTWRFDDTGWTEIVSATRPQLRSGASLVFDIERGTMLLLGGRGGYAQLTDAWALDGDTWRFVAAASGYRDSGGMAVDRPRGELLAPFGYEAVALTYQSDAVDEACQSGRDVDGDGLVGCDDPDCWGSCTPTCSPVMAEAGVCVRFAATAPRCGDGVCAPYETSRGCPLDCTTAIVAACGDFFCDAPETPATCAADCP